MRKTFLEIVRCALPFEIMLCSLERSDRRRTNVSLAFVAATLSPTHGAALVSKSMFLSFKSCGSGRCWRCFSKESRRSGRRVGERELRSMSAERSVFSVAMTLDSAPLSMSGCTRMCDGSVICPRIGCCWFYVILYLREALHDHEVEPQARVLHGPLPRGPPYRLTPSG